MRLITLIAALAGLLLAVPLAAQAPPAEPENILYLDLSTGGRVAIQLRPDVAPKHVERIKTLVRQHFYDGVKFHRVIEGFMAQGGDPTGTGEGGSQLPDLAAEFNPLPHMRGTVSMARTSDPNSANSQFFIMLLPRLSLDTKYTVFGRVISGMEYVDAIERGEPPANPSRIVQASIAADNIPPPSPQAVQAMMAPPPPAPTPAPAGVAAPTQAGEAPPPVAAPETPPPPQTTAQP
jgi:peptidylprolyl isomerase